MTTETNNVAAALLTLLAAFEAERVALHNRLVQMEDRLQTAERKIDLDLTEIERLADWNTKHSIQIANVQSEIAALTERVTDLEHANRLRGEISGMDTDELEEIKERLDLLERADGELIDEDKVREIVDCALENATFSINL